MARLIFALIVICVGRPAFAGSEQGMVTPVQKVINMLNDMMAKGKKEKEEETVAFATYQQFCKDTRVEKTRSIAKGAETIDRLEGDIAKAEEEIQMNQKAIARHDQDIAKWSTEKSTATESRKKEHADYEVEYQDYTDSMNAAERAKAQITGGADMSLVQNRAVLERVVNVQGRFSIAAVPASARRALEAFLQSGEGDQRVEALGAPEPKTYEAAAAGGARGIIEQMADNFEDKRNEIEKEEMLKESSFQQLSQDLQHSVESAKAERGEKAARVNEITAEKGEKSGELQKTKDSKAADEKYLSDLNVECEDKATDYEKRQQLRAGEITALGQAVEIMTGAQAVDHHPALAQEGMSGVFAQLRSNTVSPMQKNVAAFLTQRAQRTNSQLLSAIAARMQADSFKKITKLIRDMIGKLMAESAEEAEHKGFCDTEMGTNKLTRDEKSTEVESLTAKSEYLTAGIQKLSEEISELGDEIAAIDAQVAKASEERGKEKAKNAATIADAKTGDQATRKALTVLREFYAKVAEAAALTQYRSGALAPGAPAPTHSGSADGIIGMLEVVASDFARLDAETTASEAQAEGDFNRFMTDSKKDKAVKTADMNGKSNEKTEFEADLLAAKKDLKTTSEELAAAKEYFEKLKPSCVQAGVSYEERKAKRQAEIDSLKEALEILSNNAPAL